MQNTAGEIEGTRPSGGQGPDQRIVLSLAFRDYKDGNAEFTDGIDEQLQVVERWWSSPSPGEAFQVITADDLESRAQVDAFLHEQGVRDLQGDALVFFITGHGMPRTNPHFLKLPDTQRGRPLATAMRTSELITAALDSKVRNVLVILNTCFAAKINAELSTLYEMVSKSRRESCSINVLVTCGHDDTVEVGRFSTYLRAAWERLRRSAGVTTPHLSAATFVTEYSNCLPADERDIYALSSAFRGSHYTRPTPCLPNPGYQHVRELAGASRSQVAYPAVSYWLDRATGRPQDGDDGWYFRGRADLNRHIAAFLRSAPPRGVFLLTGTAGSGKSALLARAVLLSDENFRQDPLYKVAKTLVDDEACIPPEGSVTAAVLARHRSSEEVIKDILQCLKLPAEPISAHDDPVTCWTQQLLHHLRSRGGTFSLVLDGLDEAEEPHRIITDLLGPLNEFCSPTQPVFVPRPRSSDSAASVRLLIGVRSSRPEDPSVALGRESHSLLDTLQETFPFARLHRTDDPSSVQDIEQYVHALITAGGKHTDTAGHAAQAVAPEVWPSFIDARLAGEQLRVSPDPSLEVAQPYWKPTLQRGTLSLLKRDLMLVEEQGLPAYVAAALLRGMAFALGQGVPWSNIWPVFAASHLQGKPLDNPDEMIEKLLNSRLSGYLSYGQQDQRRVYRAAHESLAEMLRDMSIDLLDFREFQ
ncbi:ATP-binding protein (plasmid) [Streptomyces sp. NBC_00015]|uniref:ATP-binding protein n=1 Tax=Streptomyces sp. NBC_00015 TaxID=2903611 RepID=UPI002F91A857